MENSGNISDSIIQSTDAAAKSASSSGTTLLDKIRGFSPITWIIIILILAILGFNIFTYLAVGTQDISQFLKVILTKILDIIPFTVNKVVTGVENASQNVSDNIQNLQEAPEETLSNSSINSMAVETESVSEKVNTKNEQLNNVLNNSLKMRQQQSQQQQSQDYQPYEAQSSVTGGGKGETGQAGWCYIGEDRNIRTCAQVGKDDTCMSGNIFPSQEICMYPELRP